MAKSTTIKFYTIMDSSGNTVRSKGTSPLDALKYAITLHWHSQRAMIKKVKSADSNFVVKDEQKGTNSYYLVML